MSPGDSSKPCLPKCLQEKQRFIAWPLPIELDARILALVTLWARAALFGRSGDEGVPSSRITPSIAETGSRAFPMELGEGIS
jgi:hypothetical protein